ncbi:MAG TPA: BolA/IbaG family iron-sulfur metabolism protein [Solirubrobacteraceae bacterium]|nr:BolA/IbaG family iron-sulfur metabolism protein [Solirubrobacteraceae bacterium]
MPSAQEIQEQIESSIAGARAEVSDTTGGGDHFQAVVSADAFRGLSRIQQHRLVYDALGGQVGGAIHALALRTVVPAGDELTTGAADV